MLTLVYPCVSFATPVPDTGQTQSYTNTFGEDSDYDCNPHSYTDLGNGIVRDNVTGLEWQQATAPGTYTWQQAIDYCNNLSLGGKDDWRLPTIKELSTLVDSSIPYPGLTINTSYFPNTVAYYYCSSTTSANDTGNVWGVEFASGYVDTIYKSSYYYVRAVRGGQSNNNFIDNGNGTITDTSTGLMWQKATAPGTYTWEQALTYCENLTLPAGGYSDWRLPNKNELQSIVDYSRYNPAIDPTFFPGTVASDYWSSTTYVNVTSSAFSVHVGTAGVHGRSKSASIYVRAVRGGQCGSSVTTTILPTSTTTSVCDAACWEILYEQSQSQLQQCQAELQECQNQTTTTTTAYTTTAPPTNIELSNLEVIPLDEQVVLKWKTETENGNAGFNVWRADNFVKINDAIIPALGSSVSGSNYDFVDQWVLNGKRYFYLLEDIDTEGISTFHGPVKATPRLIYGLGK